MRSTRTFTVFMMAFIMLLSLGVSYVAAIEGNPLLVSPQTSFDPGFKDLESGGGAITDLGGGTIRVNGQTNATKYVDTIGVRTIIQKWDGSSWLDVYTSSDATNSNNISIYVSYQLAVTSGYYYRVQSVHWTVKDRIMEQGIRYSSSILIK